MYLSGSDKSKVIQLKSFWLSSKEIFITLVKWLATLFSQLDSLKPFPSLHRKVTLGSGVLQKQALHNGIPIKVILDVIWRQRAPHLEGLGRHHVLLVHSSVVAWKEAGNVSSDAVLKKGSSKQKSTQHFPCARYSDTFSLKHPEAFYEVSLIFSFYR